MDESACVPHRYHEISDTFLHSLSIMYLFVSNLLLNIYIYMACMLFDSTLFKVPHHPLQSTTPSSEVRNTLHNKNENDYEYKYNEYLDIFLDNIDQCSFVCFCVVL